MERHTINNAVAVLFISWFLVLRTWLYALTINDTFIT